MDGEGGIGKTEDNVTYRTGERTVFSQEGEPKTLGFKRISSRNGESDRGEE